MKDQVADAYQKTAETTTTNRNLLFRHVQHSPTTRHHRQALALSQELSLSFSRARHSTERYTHDPQWLHRPSQPNHSPFSVDRQSDDAGEQDQGSQGLATTNHTSRHRVANETTTTRYSNILARGAPERFVDWFPSAQQHSSHPT